MKSHQRLGRDAHSIRYPLSHRYPRTRSLHHQKGLTGIAIILMLAVAAFFIAIALTLFPVYMENFSVASHVHDLKKIPDVKTMTKTDITKRLMRRFDIDNVTNVTEDDIEFVQIPSGWRIEVDYEVRKPFIGNVDIVTIFHEEVEVPH